MSESREIAAQRKQLLIARSERYRAALQRDIETLRHSLHSPKALLTFATLPAARSFVFGALLLLAGRSGVGRLIRMAMTVLAIVKAGRAAGEWAKSRRATA